MKRYGFMGGNMKLKLMTGYNKRARAFKELRQKFTEITINYLQETLKKYPLDWNQIMKQRAIENLYRQLVSEAYKDQINNVDYNLNERTFSTRMLFDLPFTIKLPPVEDESIFKKFIDSDDYRELKRIDKDYNKDVTDFICIWFLTLLKFQSSQIIKRANNNITTATLYGSQLAVYQHLKNVKGSGRRSDDNIKIFIVIVQEYIKRNSIPIKQPLFYEIVTYLQDIISIESARKQFQRTNKANLHCDYNRTIIHYLERKLCLLREMNQSIYEEIRNQANQKAIEYQKNNKEKYKNVCLIMDNQGVLNYIGVRDKPIH